MLSDQAARGRTWPSTATDQPVHSVVVPDDPEHLLDVVDNDAEERSLRRLMSKGLQIAEPSLSGAVGAAVGLVGGPPGVVVGGAIGGLLSIAVKKLCFEMDNRSMGPRERARVGAVCALGAAEIVQRIDTGEKLREDGFFDRGERDRSNAEEVWESLLSKCQREASERKLPYMGHLFAGIAFDDTIGPDMAHQLISAAEQLSYRQLCILRLCANKQPYNLRPANYRPEIGEEQPVGHLVYQVLYECFGLCQSGFIDNGGSVALGLLDITPNEMRVQGLAMYVYNLMRLSLIPGSDIELVAMRLR